MNRLQRSSSVLGIWLLTACGGAGPTPPEPAAEALPVNRLVFGGDVMLSRGVRRALLAAGDPALPFRKLAPFFASADIAFVNLESPFSDRGPYADDGLIFHAPPNAIAGLNLASIDIASTANNHARDCGAYGVEYTVSWLREHGIDAVGSSDSAETTHAGIVLERHGIRFGFLAYTYDQQNGNWKDIDSRIAVANAETAARDIQSLKQRADVVIVSLHSGTEYQRSPNGAQVAFAHAAVDAGAAMVVGHHPHVVQACEQYHNRMIFYSLGNLVFDQFQREATQHGEVLEAVFTGRTLLTTRVYPVKITPAGPEFE